MRHVRIVALLAAAAVLVACTDPKTTRDKSDTTAPMITLSVTAADSTPDGTAIVAPGSTVNLTGAGGTALIKADDDKGVAWVEIWMTQAETCNGTTEGPGTAGAPAKRVEGTVTDTSAPASLTAGVDINLLPLVSGCTYKFEVWGQAANAATTAVKVKSPIAYLTFAP